MKEMPPEDSSLPTKRTLRVPDLLDEITDQKSIYPRGILGSLKESNFDSKVDRIQLFAQRQEEKENHYGILKRLFVAFSSESNLLKLAGASSNVIEVHGLPKEKRNGRTIAESKLVLKRSEVEEERAEGIVSFYRELTPSLFVSSHWLDLMNLNSGDRVIISNPRENYEIPPPIPMNK